MLLSNRLYNIFVIDSYECSLNEEKAAEKRDDIKKGFDDLKKQLDECKGESSTK